MGDGTGRGKVLIDNKPFSFLISVSPPFFFVQDAKYKISLPLSDRDKMGQWYRLL